MYKGTVSHTNHRKTLFVKFYDTKIGNHNMAVLYPWVKVSRIIPEFLPGRVAQSVACLATDASLTADPGVGSSIPARSHTLVEIDHEIISTVILLPSAESFKKGCCQLQTKVCARSTG